MPSLSFTILKSILTEGRRAAKLRIGVFPYGLFAGFGRRFFVLVSLCIPALAFCGPLAAQKIAVIVPERSVQTEKYASQLSDSLSGKILVQDREMSLTAFKSVRMENPYNLTSAQSKDIGSVLGCDYFLLIRSGTL